MRTCPTCGEQWATATVCSTCGKVLEAAGVPSGTDRRPLPLVLVGSALLLVVVAGVLWGQIDRGGSGQVVLPDASGTPPAPTGPQGDRQSVPPQVMCETDTGPIGCVRWMHELGLRGLGRARVLETNRGVVLFSNRSMRLLDGATGQTVWQQDLPFGGEVGIDLQVVAPDPGGDTLVVLARDHFVVHDLATGQTVRSLAFQGRPGLVLAAGGDPGLGAWQLLIKTVRFEDSGAGGSIMHQELQAWDTNGKRWSTQLDALGLRAWGATFLAEPDVVILTIDDGAPGPVLGLDAPTGEIVWSATRDVEPVQVGASMVLVREPGDQPGTDQLAALDPRDGTIAWQQPIPEHAMTAVPTATLVTITHRDRVTALAAATGRVAWEIDVHPRERVMHRHAGSEPDAPALLLADPAISHLRGLDLTTHEQLWARDLTDAQYQVQGVVRGNAVELLSQDRSALLVVDVVTGNRIVELRTNATFEGSQSHFGPELMILFDDERIYLASLQLPVTG